MFSSYEKEKRTEWHAQTIWHDKKIFVLLTKKIFGFHILYIKYNKRHCEIAFAKHLTSKTWHIY